MSRTAGPTATWNWDIVNDRVTWSDELYRLYGLEPREFRASYQAFIERVHPGDRQRVQLIVSQALQNRKPFHFQHRLVRPDGTVRVLDAHGAVECDAGGRPVRMSGTSVDMTGSSGAGPPERP